MRAGSRAGTLWRQLRWWRRRRGMAGAAARAGTAPTTAATVPLLLCFFLLLLQHSSPAHALLDPGDFLALQSLRKSLSDMPGSSYFSTWDFTGDPCAFPGVLCAGDRVITLSLGDPRAGSPGLIGRLDPSIGRLTALTELSLVPGRVFGSIPSTLSSLQDLRFLALSRNLLSGPVPPGFSALKRLQTLDLSFNLLTGPVPQPLTDLPALTNLILSHNRLSGSLPPFTSTSPLLRLDLKHNDLTGPIGTQLPSSLQYLSLSNNHFTGTLTLIATSNLSSLSYLDVASNNFTGLVPPPLLALPTAQTILLNRNALYGPVLPPGQVTAETVDLSYNRLFGMVSPLFSPVKQLYLNNNRFSGVVPAALVQRLADGGGGGKTLYLQHNFLTGIEIGPTAEIPMSSELCLQYNCMVPPPQSAACPLKAGTQKTRPVDQCVQWKKRAQDKLDAESLGDDGIDDDDDDNDGTQG